MEKNHTHKRMTNTISWFNFSIGFYVKYLLLQQSFYKLPGPMHRTCSDTYWLSRKQVSSLINWPYCGYLTKRTLEGGKEYLLLSERGVALPPSCSVCLHGHQDSTGRSLMRKSAIKISYKRPLKAAFLL